MYAHKTYLRRLNGLEFKREIYFTVFYTSGSPFAWVGPLAVEKETGTWIVYWVKGRTLPPFGFWGDLSKRTMFENNSKMMSRLKRHVIMFWGNTP